MTKSEKRVHVKLTNPTAVDNHGSVNLSNIIIDSLNLKLSQNPSRVKLNELPTEPTQ
jgi:hypothetical protein